VDGATSGPDRSAAEPRGIACDRTAERGRPPGIPEDLRSNGGKSLDNPRISAVNSVRRPARRLL